MSFLRLSFSLLLVLSVSFSSPVFAAWPFSEKKTEPQPAPPAPSSSKSNAVTTSTAASTVKTVKAAGTTVKKTASAIASRVEDENFFDDSGEEEEGEGDSGVQAAQAAIIPALAGLPQIPKVPQIPKIPTAKNILKGTVPAYSSNGSPEIDRVQAQIRSIIELNDQLKNQYAGQAAEIQKISEQARIHQRILQDLEKEKGEFAQEEENSESYLKREKVNLIREATKKSQQTLKTLQSDKGAAEASVQQKTAGSTTQTRVSAAKF